MVGPLAVPLDFTMLPAVLAAEGWATHAIGKWNLGATVKAYTPTFRGFDTFFGYCEAPYPRDVRRLKYFSPSLSPSARGAHPVWKCIVDISSALPAHPGNWAVHFMCWSLTCPCWPHTRCPLRQRGTWGLLVPLWIVARVQRVHGVLHRPQQLERVRGSKRGAPSVGQPQWDLRSGDIRRRGCSVDRAAWRPRESGRHVHV